MNYKVAREMFEPSPMPRPPMNHANVTYARQLIQAERDYWYGVLRSGSRADQDKARHELDHLDELEAQAR